MPEVFYHATPKEAWETSVRRVGLRKYPLSEATLHSLSAHWGPLRMGKGIWLWPFMTEKLAHECFFWQRATKYGALDFAFLRVYVQRDWLLSTLLEKKYGGTGAFGTTRVRLSHPMMVNSTKVHEEPFDISLRHIEARRIELMFFVSEHIWGPETPPRGRLLAQER